MYIYFIVYLDLKRTTKERDPNIHKILEILEELKKQGGERPPAEDSLLKYHQEHQTFKAVGISLPRMKGNIIFLQ